MVFIVIPAYNEEKNIGRVIRGLFEHGFKQIVVVDDGSADQTAKEAAALGATVLRHTINRGQGAALQTGNDYALRHGAQTIVHFDADGQFNPADIASALKSLEEKPVDVILGSRFLDNRSHLPWFKKYILLPTSRWINTVLTRLRLSDAHNGFRILNRRAAEAIIIAQDGMAHNSEIAAQIQQKRLRWAEHPVEVTYYEYGQGTREGFKIVKDLLFGALIK